MKRAFVLLIAIAAVAGACGAARADVMTNTMGTLPWTVYDNFPGPSLDTTKWGIDSSSTPGVVPTIGNGLTVSLKADQEYGIYALPYFNTTQFFAVEVPFSVSNQSVGGLGSLDHLSLDIDSMGNSSRGFFVAWGEEGSNSYGLGAGGSGFIAGIDSQNGAPAPGTVNGASSAATSGMLGLLYVKDTGTIYLGYDTGGGWTTLYSTSDTGWTSSDNLQFDLDAGVAGPGSLMVSLGTVNVDTVPLPASALLFAPGLLGLIGIRRRFKA